MAEKLTVGLDFIIPAEVAGGETAEVFTVYRIITQAGLPPVYDKEGNLELPGAEPATTVLMTGVNTGKQIALGLPQLAELGWPVQAREEET